MIKLYRDRLGRTVSAGPSWFRLTLGWHPAAWFGSLHVAKRVVWLRSINYKAIEAHD